MSQQPGDPSESSFGGYTAGSAFSQQSFSENVVESETESWQVTSVASSKHGGSLAASISGNIAVRSSSDFAKEQLWDSPTQDDGFVQKQPELERSSESLHSHSGSYSQESISHSGSYSQESISQSGSYSQESGSQYDEEECSYYSEDSQEYQDGSYSGEGSYVEEGQSEEYGEQQFGENDQEYDNSYYEEEALNDGSGSADYADIEEYQDHDEKQYGERHVECENDAEAFEDANDAGEFVEQDDLVDGGNADEEISDPDEGVEDDERQEDEEDYSSGGSSEFHLSFHSRLGREAEVDKDLSSVTGYSERLGSSGEFAEDLLEEVKPEFKEDSISSEEAELQASYHVTGGQNIAGEEFSVSRSVSNEQKLPRNDDDSGDESDTGWESPPPSDSQHAEDHSENSCGQQEVVAETNFPRETGGSLNEEEALPSDDVCEARMHHDSIISDSSTTGSGSSRESAETESGHEVASDDDYSDAQSNRSDSDSRASEDDQVVNEKFSRYAQNDDGSLAPDAMDEIMSTAKGVLDEQMSSYFMDDESTGHDEAEMYMEAGHVAENLNETPQLLIDTKSTDPSDQPANDVWTRPVDGSDEPEQRALPNNRKFDKDWLVSADKALHLLQSKERRDFEQQNLNSSASQSRPPNGQSNKNEIFAIENDWLSSADKALEALQRRHGVVSNQFETTQSHPAGDHRVDAVDRYPERNSVAKENKITSPLPNEEWLRAADTVLEKLSHPPSSQPSTDTYQTDQIDVEPCRINDEVRNNSRLGNEGFAGTEVTSISSGSSSSDDFTSESSSVDDEEENTSPLSDRNWLRSADVALEKLHLQNATPDTCTYNVKQTEPRNQNIDSDWLSSADHALQALRDRPSAVNEFASQSSDTSSSNTVSSEGTSDDNSSESHEYAKQDKGEANFLPADRKWQRSADLALEKPDQNIDSDWLTAADQALQALQKRQPAASDEQTQSPAHETVIASISNDQEASDVSPIPDKNWLKSADMALQRLINKQTLPSQADTKNQESAGQLIDKNWLQSADRALEGLKTQGPEPSNESLVRTGNLDALPGVDGDASRESESGGSSSSESSKSSGSRSDGDLWGMNESSSSGNSSDLGRLFGRTKQTNVPEYEDDEADELVSIMSEMSDDLGKIEEDNEDSGATRSPLGIASVNRSPVAIPPGSALVSKVDFSADFGDLRDNTEKFTGDVEAGLVRSKENTGEKIVSMVPIINGNEDEDSPMKTASSAFSKSRRRADSDEKSYISTLDDMTTDNLTVTGLSKEKKIVLIAICSVVLLLILILPWVIWNKRKNVASPTSFKPPFQTGQGTIPPPLPTSGQLLSWTLTGTNQGGVKSESGAAIAIDSTHAFVGEPFASKVVVRRYDPDKVGWTENQSLVSDEDGDRFGASIDLLNDKMVIGAPAMTAPETNIQVGGAFCYQYNPELGQWFQLGSALRGDLDMAVALGEGFGSTVSVSSSYRIAVGAPKSSAVDLEAGRIYTFEYDKIEELWRTLEVFPLAGYSAGDRFGSALALSNDGLRFVGGAPRGTNNKGYVLLYDWKDNGWEELLFFEGESSGERFGSSVVMLSDSGDIVAIGAPGYNNGAGRIAIYQLTDGRFTKLGNDLVGQQGDVIGTLGSLDGGASQSGITVVFSTQKRQVKRADYSFHKEEWEVKYRDVSTDASTKTTVSYYSDGMKDFLAVGMPDTDLSAFYEAEYLGSQNGTAAPTAAPSFSIPSANTSTTSVPTQFRTAAPTGTPPISTTEGPTPLPTTFHPTMRPVDPIQSKWIESGGPYRIGPRNTGFGGSLALSETKMATGAHLGLEVGIVLAFQKEGDYWGANPIQQLAGEQKGGEFGAAIHMRDDLMVVGAPGVKDSNSNTPSGAAYCYIYDGGWRKLGSTILSDAGLYAANEKFGTSVAVSKNKRIAIGAPASSVSLMFNRGRVYIYEYKESSGWSKSVDILGKSAGEALGSAVDISSNGKYLIVGSPGSGGGFATIYLHSVFNWFEVSKISGIDREKMGTSVHFIDESGVMAAAGAPGYDKGRGRVVVFMRDTSGKYQQLGPSIIGEPGERIGDKNRLAGSGSDPSIIVGTSTGLVKRYDLDLSTSSWVQTVVSADTGFRSVTGLLSVVSFGDSFAAGGDDTTTIYDLSTV